MQNSIIFVTGNEWDQGKDVLTRLLLEHARYARLDFVLVEPYWTRPKLSEAYAGWVDAIAFCLELENEVTTGISQLRALLRGQSDETVIVNLPGDRISDTESLLWKAVRPLIGPMDLEIVMVYLAGPSERTHNHLEAVWEAGLGAEADICVAVPNGFYGNTRDFVWHGSALRRFGWLPLGGEERVMGRMSPSAMQAVRKVRGPLWVRNEPYPAGMSSRQHAGVARWIDQHWPLAFLILYGPEALEDVPEELARLSG